MNGATIQLQVAPRFIVGAGLLLWGWQNAFLIYALAMALVIEVARWTHWRWSVTDKEFNYVSDLSSIILLVLVIYVFNTEGSKGIFTILSLMPFVFFPLVLVQTYSESGGVGLTALFISLRRLDPLRHPEARTRIDLTLPFFLTCLISASAGNRYSALFFAAVCLLLGIVLWTLRPRRYTAGSWVGLFTLAIVLGYTGQYGLTVLQARAEGYAMQVFERFFWRFRDPNMAATAIGSIGRIKLSDRIVLRVRSDSPLQSPLLLREATYDTFGYGIWSSQAREFSLVDPDITGTSWSLADQPGRLRVSVSTYMSDVAGVIPLPHASSRIRDVNATEITRNPYGSVKMEIKEGWTSYTAEFNDAAAQDAAPADRDLFIADNYRDTFSELAQQLDLYGKDPSHVMEAIRNFFADGFTYSLTLQHRYPRGKYLAEFLFSTRSGHCEFFATATVLLLRAAGVPARYAVGFAVDEYSGLERQYVARARHAHSWALGYVGGAWRVLDTTPAVWSPLEQAQASGFEPLFDLFSWISFKYSRWQSGDALEEETDNRWLLWLLVPLLGTLIWRMYFKVRVVRKAAPTRREERFDCPGLDSSLYRLVAELEKAGFRRRPGETLEAWLGRIEGPIREGPWRAALAIHYRYRFDPAGISRDERDALNRHVDTVLSAMAHA